MVINHMCLLNYPSKSYKPLILIYFFYYYFSISALIIYLLSLSKKNFSVGSIFSTSRRKASRTSKGSISASVLKSSLATFSNLQDKGVTKMAMKSMSDSLKKKCLKTLINWDVKMDGNRDDAKVKRRPQVCWFSEEAVAKKAALIT